MKWLKSTAIIVALLFSVSAYGATITKGLIGEQDLHKWDGTTADKTFTRPSSVGGTLTLNSVGYEVDALISYGGSVNYTKATIDTALTAIGTVNKVTLLLRPGTWPFDVDANYSAYANVTWKVVPGALLQIATGKTLTIGGPFEAGLYQVFSGAGSVVFGTTSNKRVYPQWWGAIANLSTDATNAINAALNAFNGLGGTVVISGRFAHASPLIMKQKTTLEGDGPTFGREPLTANYKGVNQLHNTGTGVGIRVFNIGASSPEYGVVIRDLWISGTSASDEGILVNGVYNGIIENCVIYDHGATGIHGQATCQGWIIQNNFLQANNGSGIYWYGLAEIIGNYIESNDGYGLSFDTGTGNITGNVIENNGSVAGYADLRLVNPLGVSVTGNYFEMTASSTGSAILVQESAYGLIITGNFIATNTTGANFGIDISISAGKGARGIVIHGNDFAGAGWDTGVRIVTTGSLGLDNAILGPNNMLAGGTHGIKTPYSLTGPYTGVKIHDAVSSWEASTYYRVDVFIKNSAGLIYKCITLGTSAASGGPTTTAADITDGTVHWKYMYAYDTTEKVYSNVYLSGRILTNNFIASGTTKSEPGSGHKTLTAAMLIGGLVDEDPEGAANWTLDTAANIVAALAPHGAAGNTFRTILHNDATGASGEVVTILTGAGVTLHGQTVTLTEGTNEVAELIFRITDAGIGTEAVDCYIK